MNSITTDFIEITDVQYQSGYTLKLTFNDGRKQVIDFEPFLRKSQHPEIQKYLDIKRFRQYTFEYGYFHWNNYDLSFSIDDLYDGQIT
ncbi:MAG: DUF2442 domain-containing protein [Candidatus Anammoxibacter sp.]